MKNGSNQRDAKWTESIAAGDKEFVMETTTKLGAKATGRRELENNEGYELNIHLIPVRAKMVPDLGGLNKHPYCDHSALMGKQKKRAWQETDYVLLVFGNTPAVARRS